MNAAQPPHIGIAINNTRHAPWAFLEQGAVERAEQLGIKLSVVSASTREEQSAIVHEFIRQRVSVLIITSLGDIVPDSEAAQRAGIPVITCEVGNEKKHASVHCDVHQNLREGAKLITDYLAKRLGGQGKIMHLNAPGSRLRNEGFYNALTHFPNIQIIESMGDWFKEGSKNIIRETLNAHPDIRAIFAHNDDMALGAVDVVEEIKRTGEIMIAGVDGIPEALQAMNEGRMTATISTMAHITGRIAVETAVQVLNGETVPPFINTPVKLITPDTLMSAVIEELIIVPRLISSLAKSNKAQRQLQEEIIAFQRNLIRELSTPTIPISDEILVMPLSGTVDTTRAQEIMDTMLQAIEHSNVRVLIIDITGINMIDTEVANHLVLSAQAARLLGVRVMLVGIRPEVAQTIVHLGINLSSILTASTLQTGIEYANAHLVHKV